jgi:hypothetical protein
MNAKFDLAVRNATTTSPVVRDNGHPSRSIPWWLRSITCNACHETYWLIRNDTIEPYFLSKVGKGFAQSICLLFKNGPTCMRWVETYGELLRGNMYSGVLDPEFVC